MAQSTFSIRMDETLKKQFDSLCAEFGMNATTAFNVFAKTVVREKKIPFEIGAKKTADKEGLEAFLALRKEVQEKGLPEWSQEEINEFISEVRRERRERKEQKERAE